MFDEGSLFWVFSIVFRSHLFYFIWLIVTLSVAYGILRFAPILASPVRQFHLNKLFYATVISQITMLLISAAYVAHHHSWSLQPHAAYGIKFSSTLYHFIILMFFAQFALLLCVIITKATSPLKWADLGLRKYEVRTWVIIKLVFVSIIIIILINQICVYLKGSPFKDTELFIESIKSIRSIWQIFYIIWLIILTPFIEELFFRGLIFGTLKEISGYKSALVLQAILFTVIHNETAIADMLPLFVSGLALGYVYHRSESLFPSIIIHSILIICAVTMGFL